MSNNLVAIVFPGQGSQQQNMLQDFYTNFSIFKNVISECSEYLNYDLWNLITTNPDEKLHKTEFTQPALLATSFALWKVWQTEGGAMPNFLAGHSLGEFTALVVANSLKLKDALTIVSTRGRLMQEAVSDHMGAMAAIIGLENSQVEAICTEVAGDENLNENFVSPANYNAPGQVVISGLKDAVNSAMKLAKQNGAKLVRLLPVSVPSHCSLMQNAAMELAKVLQDIEFNAPQIPIIHNFDVTTHVTKNSISDALVKQLYNPVRWTETIEYLASNNVTKVIECGPGKILTGLNKRITNSLVSAAISDVENFQTELKTRVSS